ncbi:SDR family NAD(P)-dependent oxidoreductase [Streptomyces cadmiisoli]|uniref:SDR family NAD(P)-dependent oxidoreductase n=1 Tax=Streptomyces cadmiisoli TaxID=2184053 RepID=UPI003668F6A2
MTAVNPPSSTHRPLVVTPFGARATAAEVLDGIDLTGRRAVVTGGASGIGTETVRVLAAAGAEVTVATRRPELAQQLVRELGALPQSGAVTAVPLDLADLSSVEAFTRAWRGPLDILVANAGIMALPTRELSSRGWEMQLATNFLGHFALATALHPALSAAGEARVVMVSSGAHRKTPFDFDDPHFERRPYDAWQAYGQSKTADVLFAVGARRWAEDGITANAASPGFIMTNLKRHLDDDTLRAMGVMDADGEIVIPPHFKTPEQGAATSVLLAASPLLKGVTGAYFEDNQEAKVVRGDEEERGGVAAHALDRKAADRLWNCASVAVR